MLRRTMASRASLSTRCSSLISSLRFASLSARRSAVSIRRGLGFLFSSMVVQRPACRIGPGLPSLIRSNAHFTGTAPLSRGLRRGRRLDHRSYVLPIPEDVANGTVVAFSGSLNRVLVRRSKYVFLLYDRPPWPSQLVDPIQLHVNPQFPASRSRSVRCQCSGQDAASSGGLPPIWP